MNPDDLLESYVSDVARRLPRAQRADVALELRTLLRDELLARADAEGRPVDEEMARALLVGFGRPAEAAARYRPTPVIIDPADSRRFLRLTVTGVAVIWVLGLVAVLRQRPIGSTGDVLAVLGTWWAEAGVQALWWPGLLVVGFAAAAWVRRHRPGMAVWRPRRRRERDQVNRLGYAAALVFFVVGILVLANPAVILDQAFGGRAAPAAYQALAYDAEFFRHRAPWLLVLMLLHLALYATLIVQGRWRPLTRQIDIGLSLVMCGVLAWVLLAGAIFQARPTDDLVKAVILLIIITALLDVSVKLRRERRRITYDPCA